MDGPWKGDFRINTAWRYSNGSPHYSWDIACPMGTPLYAIGDGVIVDCNDGVKDQPPGKPAGSGAPSNWIILKFTSPDGKYKGQTLYAYYQHLKKNSLKVKPGQRVKQGELIGLSGNSGNTTGPHLHLTVLKPGYVMNRSTRYLYLNNPGWVLWTPDEAWGGVDYRYKYTVYVNRLKPGVNNSKSVRKLRECLAERGFITLDAPLNKKNPGNRYTPKVERGVKLWQKKHGYKQTGVLTNKQAKEFFKNNTKTKVVPE